MEANYGDGALRGEECVCVCVCLTRGVLGFKTIHFLSIYICIAVINLSGDVHGSSTVIFFHFPFILKITQMLKCAAQIALLIFFFLSLLINNALCYTFFFLLLLSVYVPFSKPRLCVPAGHNDAAQIRILKSRLLFFCVCFVCVIAFKKE